MWVSLVTGLFTEQKPYSLEKKTPTEKQSRRELLPSLRSPSTHRVGWLWPQVQMYHFPTNSHLIFLMPHKEILSQLWASLVVQLLKNPPAMQGIQVWSLGWEDPLEKEMATHSSILAWRIIWTGQPGGLHNCDLKWAPTPYLTAHIFFYTHLIPLKIISYSNSTYASVIIKVGKSHLLPTNYILSAEQNFI